MKTTHSRFITIRSLDNHKTVQFSRHTGEKAIYSKTVLNIDNMSARQLNRLDALSYSANRVTCMFFAFGTMITMGFFGKSR